MKQKKTRGLRGLIGLNALVLMAIIIATGCREAPDDYNGTGPKDWSVAIKGPSGVVYLGDSIELRAILSGLSGNDSAQAIFNWSIKTPSGNILVYDGPIAKVKTAQIGNYNAELTASALGKSETATLKITANRRGVIVSIAQKGGEYQSGDELEFDSLEINFKITAAPGDSLGRFSLDFGDNSVLDTIIEESSQVILSHCYSDYGEYLILFTNSEVVVKTITIKDPDNPDGKDPDDEDPDGDVNIKYDVDLADYKALKVKTTYPDAMFGKIDSAESKFWLLISVAATERTIGPDTKISLKGNWDGTSYTAWTTYLTSTGKDLVVTSKKGKYIKLEISDFTYNFKYRGNVLLGDVSNYINAQNLAPYYGEDLDIGDTGTLRVEIDYEIGVGSFILPPKSTN
ncbi:MAG: hypothetical protein WC545_02925 [Patescibacteria group bacterium]